MEELIALLKKHHMTIGSCESFTAGLFTSTLAEVSGASAVLKGGIVTYMTACKIDMVHVDEDIIKNYGVVSAECVEEMAVKARKLLDVDICVSFSGNAGPSAMEGKPAGLVYCGLAMKDKAESYECRLTGTRNEVRQHAVDFMCEIIKETLNRQ